MFFKLTVPTVYAAVDAQTPPVPSMPTGAQPFGATVGTVVRRLRALGAAVAGRPRHGADHPRAFGAIDAELARLDHEPTVHSADELRWSKVMWNQFGVRRL